MSVNSALRGAYTLNCRCISFLATWLVCIALAIRQELAVPVWYIGVGEGIDDLQPFSAKDFVDALF